MYLYRGLYFLPAALAASSSTSAPLLGNYSQYPEYEELQALASSAHTTALASLKLQNGTGACTPENIKTRIEWDDLTTSQQKDYVRAVRCMQTSDSVTPAGIGSSIKSRYDDFIATHMNQTLTIHYTGSFLTWHRYFLHLYEEALTDECGYDGPVPYWNWPKTAITGMHASPIFDGSETSLSGDGLYIANQSEINCASGNSNFTPFWVPAGTGGGCVTSGPFVNYTLNLGPIALAIPGGTAVTNPYNDTGIFSWNPRCLKRDLTDYINQNFANASHALDVLQNYPDIATFQLIFQGTPPAELAGGTTLGVHGGGHWSLGGDPGRDLYTSPGDPAFYLHHAMIDRMWWIWQMQDPATRVYGNNTIAGTHTFYDSPASANATVEDWVNYGYATGPPRQIKDLLSTTAGPFCYVYA